MNTVLRNTETGKEVTIFTDGSKARISLVCDPEFLDAMEGLQSFVLDNNADCDMAYDWVCDQANCSSFVDDLPAWDMFYFNWQSAAFDADLDDAIIAGDTRF